MTRQMGCCASVESCAYRSPAPSPDPVGPDRGRSRSLRLNRSAAPRGRGQWRGAVRPQVADGSHPGSLRRGHGQGRRAARGPGRGPSRDRRYRGPDGGARGFEREAPGARHQTRQRHVSNGELRDGRGAVLRRRLRGSHEPSRTHVARLGRRLGCVRPPLSSPEGADRPLVGTHRKEGSSRRYRGGDGSRSAAPSRRVRCGRGGVREAAGTAGGSGGRSLHSLGSELCVIPGGAIHRRLDVPRGGAGFVRRQLGRSPGRVTLMSEWT